MKKNVFLTTLLFSFPIFANESSAKKSNSATNSVDQMVEKKYQNEYRSNKPWDGQFTREDMLEANKAMTFLYKKFGEEAVLGLNNR